MKHRIMPKLIALTYSLFCASLFTLAGCFEKETVNPRDDFDVKTEDFEVKTPVNFFPQTHASPFDGSHSKEVLDSQIVALHELYRLYKRDGRIDIFDEGLKLDFVEDKYLDSPAFKTAVMMYVTLPNISDKYKLSLDDLKDLELAKLEPAQKDVLAEYGAAVVFKVIAKENQVKNIHLYGAGLEHTFLHQLSDAIKSRVTSFHAECAENSCRDQIKKYLDILIEENLNLKESNTITPALSLLMFQSYLEKFYTSPQNKTEESLYAFVDDVANQVRYVIFDLREGVATYQIEKAKANDSNLKPFLLYGAVHPFPSIRKSKTISLNRLLPYGAKLIENFTKQRSDKLISIATRKKVNNWFTDKAGIPADVLENAYFNGFLPEVS